MPSHVSVLTHCENVLSGVDTSSADVTLTLDELKNVGIIKVSKGHATNALILPVLIGKVLIVNNPAAAALLVKRAEQETPVTIATGKSAIIYCNGTDYVRLTADA